MAAQKIDKKKAKILFLFTLITLGFAIFLGTLLYWAQIDRKLPSLQTSESSTALRGDIFSSDGFVMARSQKLYKSMVDTRNINPAKRDIFIKLYSLYSGDDPKSVANRLTSNSGNVVLSYQISSKNAAYLQELASKLFRLGVFQTYEDPVSGLAFLRGLSIVESGEKRFYPHSDTFSPTLGYVKKVEEGAMTKVAGVKGVEGYYEEYLAPIQDALLVAPRDISNTTILNRDSRVKQRIDGYGAQLTISLKLQKMIERIVDEQAKAIDALEVVAGVMHSQSGEILALASSKRYNPNRIERKDYPTLNATAVEHIFEPGSVMKAIMFSLLLKEEKVNPFDLVRTYGGRYKLGRHTIRDTHESEWLSAEDVVVYSSNVGSVQLAQKLDAVPYYQGLKDFGFTRKSGVDLPYENPGSIPSLQRFDSQIYKATVGYGYGMQANFMQLLKAYNVFNNQGRMNTPHITRYLIDREGGTNVVPKPEATQVLTPAIAKRMKRILIKAVEKGTGTAAAVEGLEIGGKTGTAHIASEGGYSDIYNGTFFGFVNDATTGYTIGVLAREPKKAYHYFGSKSAAPVFKSIVETMIEEGFLRQNLPSKE
jgi:cell division protein FtsI (penicillin-binding protein 3)